KRVQRVCHDTLPWFTSFARNARCMSLFGTRHRPMAKVPPKRHFKIIRSRAGCNTTPDGTFPMKTTTSLAISSVLFLLSESLIAGERGGGVGFLAPAQQSVNPAPAQPATSGTPVARTARTKRGPHFPGGGNGNIQPRNGNPGQGSQGSVSQGGPNRPAG